ncbi:MAG: hypothetical protein JKY19_10780 [Alcanivoracaceae bacterium]|nr:hypothetical protein [Alcanivoracaceae bacterium]
MSYSEILITITNEESEILNTLQPLILEALSKNNSVEIKDSNIEENIGMKRKDIVLSFLISIGANITYDGLKTIITDVVKSQEKECVIEVIELGNEINIEKNKGKK